MFLPEHALHLGLMATAVFLGSALITRFLVWWLPKLSRLDTPNDRSLHTTPVPRGGGWAIIVPFILVLFLWRDFIPAWQELILATTVLVFISWLDDRTHVPAHWRLLIHCLASALVVFTTPPEWQVVFWLDPLLERALLTVALVWYMNLTNFMDGIDGLTATQMMAISLGIILSTFIISIAPTSIIMCVALFAAAAGFLLFNWHKAKIFMGDVGSVPVGLLAGYTLLTLAWQGYGAAALLLPAYSVADATITLFKRLFAGKKIWQAHREHFYQQATLAWQRHDKTVIVLCLCHAALLLLALLSLVVSPMVALAGILPVGGVLYFFHRAGKKHHAA